MDQISSMQSNSGATCMSTTGGPPAFTAKIAGSPWKPCAAALTEVGPGQVGRKVIEANPSGVVLAK